MRVASPTLKRFASKINFGMWYLYTRNGTKLKIPADPFVFWANLCEHLVVSSPESTNMLWCFEGEDVCFSSTLLEADMWQYGSSCITGQWKLGLSKEGNDMKCRLSLLKPMPEALFPANACPSWLHTLRKLQSVPNGSPSSAA
jgi:hypothetical protein